MPRRRHTPVVPLEAGAGPENPPCPACGEPLFGWLPERPGLIPPVRRCESCGLAVAGSPGGPDEALKALDRMREGDRLRIANRAGVAAWIGDAGWAGIEPGSHHLFTPESVRRLIARRDQAVVAQRWRPGTGLRTTWQTLLNSVTFGHNVALMALGKAGGLPAQRASQRRLDGLVSVVLAIPALLLALPIEAVAGLAGRGAALEMRTRLL